MNLRRFSFSDGKSDKFWEISVAGRSHTVRFGRTGTSGQTQTKEFASEAAAQATAEKLVQEKVRKGYVEEAGDVCGGVPAGVTVAELPLPAKREAVTKTAEPEAGAEIAEVAQLQDEPAPSVLRRLDPELRPTLALEPHFWFRATWRNLPPLERGAPPPFHPKEAGERLRRVTTSNSGWEWHWEKAELPLAMTRDEAAFWLAAFLASRAYTTPREQARELAKKVPEVDALPQVIAQLERAYWVSGAVLLPLSQLFSPVEVVQELLACPHIFTVGGRGGSYLLQARLGQLEGLAQFVIPYLSGEEREQLKERIRPGLAPSRWPPTNAAGRHQPAETAFFLAALLGLSDELQQVVDLWPDDAYAGEGVQAISHQQPQEIVLGLGRAEAVEHHMRRLKLRLRTPGQIGAWLAHTESSALATVRDAILTEPDRDRAGMMMAVLAQVRTPEAAPVMVDLLLGSKASAGARHWLEQNPEHAVAGLVAIAGGRGRQGEAAAAYLRAVLRKGGEPLIRAMAEAAPAEVRERIRACVLQHPEALALPLDLEAAPQWLRQALASPPGGSFPAWVTPSDLPPLMVGDWRLDDEQTSVVLAALARSTPEAPAPLVAAFREHVSRDVLDRFAWRLFEVWLMEGAAPKEKWAMQALAYWGGDAAALHLAPLIRKWPGENQHQRAVLGLECLRGIGTDTALMLINGIAQKVAFKGIKARAAECMEAIARDRGLTRVQLEDRIVPDCELDERGQRSFDFGSRRFDFVLGPGMKPMVREPDGKARPDLPKPGARDDAELAAQALTDWKLLKKQVADVAKIQAVRLEQAMVTGRRWTAEELDLLLVRHPLMTHLVRLLVWGTYTHDGQLTGSFRVTEDQTLADEHDAPYSLPGRATVGVVHPLELTPEQRQQWGEVFSDYELVPPFLQLGRPIFSLEGEAARGKEIGRFAGVKIPPQTLVFTLEKLGWERGIPQDAGGFYSHSKVYGGANITAVAEYEPGIFVGSIADSGDQEVRSAYFLPGTQKPQGYPDSKDAVMLGQVSRIALSEVLADLASIVAKVR